MLYGPSSPFGNVDAEQIRQDGSSWMSICLDGSWGEVYHYMGQKKPQKGSMHLISYTSLRGTLQFGVDRSMSFGLGRAATAGSRFGLGVEFLG